MRMRMVVAMSLLGLFGVCSASCDDPAKSYYASLAIQSQVFEWTSRQYGIASSDLPEECELLLTKDMHFEHNQLKVPESLLGGRHLPRCKSCRKTFKTHAYLDRHIRLRHSPAPQHLGRCLSRFCSFIPCHHNSIDHPITHTLHEHHPERSRTAHTCRKVLAQCFPPSRGPAFLQAHHALEAHLCEGKPLPMSSKTHSFPVGRVLSWIIIAGILVFYASYAVAYLRKPRFPSSNALHGLRKGMAEQEKHQRVTTPNKPRRQLVGQEHDGANSEATHTRVTPVSPV